MTIDMSRLRGNPDTSKAIFKQVRSVTENLESPIGKPSSSIQIGNGGGAAESMRKRQALQNPVVRSPAVLPVSETKGFEKDIIKRIDLGMYFDTLFESLTLLKETKDYSSVVRGMLTYYLAGNLDKYLIEGIQEEDKQEILGIIKDFEKTVRNSLR
jgi:hypothetical protein